jgi:hypothetical protein
VQHAGRGGSDWCRDRTPLVKEPMWAVSVVVPHVLVLSRSTSRDEQLTVG